MTIPMPTMERIRAMDARGTSARQIAKELGVSRNTVAKYVAHVEVMAKIAADSRRIDHAEIEMGATRTTEPAQPGAGSVDLRVYDRLTERVSA